MMLVGELVDITRQHPADETPTRVDHGQEV
jgi:hypothetical protein